MLTYGFQTDCCVDPIRDLRIHNGLQNSQLGWLLCDGPFGIYYEKRFGR